MDLKKHLRNELASLGKDANEVAATLKAKGITGKRKDSCNCPVANYLKQSWVTDKVSVATVTANVDGQVQTTLPAAVENFVRKFDSGTFPELDKENVSSTASAIVPGCRCSACVPVKPSYSYGYKSSYNW